MATLFNPGAAGLWTGNSVVSGVAREHETGPVVAPFSLKAVRRGVGEWRVEGRSFRVDEGSFLLVNEGQEYALTIDSPTPVETFCLFVSPSLLPDFACANRLETLPAALANRIDDPRPWDEDDFVRLASYVATLAGGTEPRLAGLRPATRDEVLHRLEIGRDYLLANAERSPKLEEVANVAAMSPFHFHRLFRQAYGVTPLEMLTTHRMRRAQRQLGFGMPLSQVCAEAGYASLPTFCRTFARVTGARPRDFRNAQDRITAPS